MIFNPTLTTPIGLGVEVPPDAVDMAPDRVRRIEQVFDEQITRGLHPGAQLVVLRHGQVVVDRAGGIADVRRRIPVTSDTPFLTFSCTKALTGMCIHRLIEEGKIAWDAPVAQYWPEFGCRGKEKATIRHVLLHQAGVPTRGLQTQIFLWPSWRLVTRNVAGLAAEYEPGTRTAYHLVNYGFILGEVVRRVTGQAVESYLRQTYLNPLRMSRSWLGFPAEARRGASGIYWGDPMQRQAVTVFNLPFIRRAVVPAATLNSNARGLAIFYQMLLNGGQYAGRRYVRPETIAAATALGYEGPDHTIGVNVRWAHGFHLGGVIPGDSMTANGMGKGSTIRTFGHFGQASCMAWADPAASIVVVFLCNRLLGDAAVAARYREISDAVWDAL
jgi:CubicO group peptidase (beta-lactamase class C family)